MPINEKSIFGTADALIFFDNIRVDQYVKFWRSTISLSGGMGQASVEMVYAPEFYRITTQKADGSFTHEDGIEDMTTLRIFSKNMVNGKYIQVFEGNIRGKRRTKSEGSFSIEFNASDYMPWLNRTIVPLAIPFEATYRNQLDILRWRAQGIDTTNVATLTSASDISFTGKNVREYISDLIQKTLTNNKLFSDPNTVAAWDNPANRIKVMGDISEDLVKSQVVDFLLTTDATYLNSMYVAFNDIARNLMFEFYQDRDGIIRMKPPFWNEKILRDHVIDPMFIMSYNEDTNYENRISRVVVAGALEEWQLSAASDYSGMFTPAVAYVGDLTSDDNAFFASSADTSGSGSSITSGEAVAVGNTTTISSTELEKIRWTIQAEAGGGSLKHKQIIARVIRNRLEAIPFPNSINEILTEKQFNGVKNYTTRQKEPDTDTLKAVEGVFVDGSAPDNSKGALYFYNPSLVTSAITHSWFNKLTFLFTLEGHNFYR